MKQLTLLILIILTSSCIDVGNITKDNITIFNNIYFKTAASEYLINSKENITNFHDLVKSKFVQLPLFRVLKGENYFIYLALPYKTNIKKLAANKLYPEVLFSKTDSSNYSYTKYSSKESYIIEYSKKINDNLLYVLVVSKDSHTYNNNFELFDLEKRIIVK